MSMAFLLIFGLPCAYGIGWNTADALYCKGGTSSVLLSIAFTVGLIAVALISRVIA